MWEPFSEPARRAVVRAQQVALMFGSGFIGTEHLAFALAEGDDDVGHLLANALDRDEIRARLGTLSEPPQQEIQFTHGAKRTIELAFVNARRLNHEHIGIAHLALGLLDSGDALDRSDPPALIAGSNLEALRTELARVAAQDDPRSPRAKHEG
jgi:ATP-dependent Clp protease ATP-binding subunit ClpC